MSDTLWKAFELAEEMDAAVLVCGSRRLTVGERIFSASVGTELAALSKHPVAIVPPDAAAAYSARGSST